MKKVLLLVVGVVIIIAVGIWGFDLLKSPLTTDKDTTKSNASQLRIGFSLGTLQEERWQKDADLFTARAKELGASVDVQYSGEDSALQISQAENLIIQGVKVLVVVPYDGKAAATIVEKAHVAGVKVIAYDRMITNSDVDLYLTFDSRKLGELQAQEVTKSVSKGKFAYVGGSPSDNNASLLKQGSMKVLDPLIKKNDITIVSDTFNQGWSPDEAYKTIKQYLSSGKKLDAVVAANDGTAGGVIRALKEFGLAGKVPISGQDADIAACQRVLDGSQTMTIYKPLSQLAKTAAEEAVKFAKGENPMINGSINNGKIDVPSYFLDPIVVTKDNLDSAVIDSGFHTREEIYGKK
jgi:D-xylose transport system substrate-binding protein